MKTIKELYDYSKQLNAPLLSDYNSEWWQVYLADYSNFDQIFSQLYKSFEFYDQDCTDTIEDIYDRFRLTIRNWLLINDKRYAELWRVHVIEDDDSYSITNNYDRHEEYSGAVSSASNTIEGARTDIDIDQIGEQNQAGLNNVIGWNSDAENANDSNTSTMGNREDIKQFTKGRQQNTNAANGADSHTSRIYGNIGVSTVDDMLKKHTDYWQAFNFYMIIFTDICDQFLLIGRM